MTFPDASCSMRRLRLAWQKSKNARRRWVLVGENAPQIASAVSTHTAFIAEKIISPLANRNAICLCYLPSKTNSQDRPSRSLSAKSVQAKAQTEGHLGQQIDEMPLVMIVAKDGFAFVAAN